jgi:hypothetical protein
MTTKEKQMSEENTQGVGNYNILSITEIINDNILVKRDNLFESSCSGPAANAAEEPRVFTNLGVSGVVELEGPTPQDVVTQDLIKMDDVTHAPIQLYCNDSTQKYKLKIQLNCVDGNKFEFIANMTNDRRNFCKYLPEASREWFKIWTDDYAAAMRQQDVKIYRGKFHLNVPFVAGKKQKTQIEDYCAAVMWYDRDLQAWCGVVSLYEFVTQFILDKGNITIKQAKANLLAQTMYQSRRYKESVQRPKTLWQIKNNK